MSTVAEQIQLHPFQSRVEEVIGLEEIREKLQDRSTLRVYWGTAPTKAPHLAYFVPLLKLRDLIRAGHHVTILLADVHSYLDKGFEMIGGVDGRTEEYQIILTAMMSSLGVAEDEYCFVRGSSFQLDRRYNLDLFKFLTLVTVRSAQRAGSEVVKQPISDSDTAPDAKEKALAKHILGMSMSSLVYPLMQCLDETALEADVELGGRDQRKIFMMSRDFVEKLGYSKCAYLMNPLIPPLNGKTFKMSASDPQNSKISLLDSPEQVERKIQRAFCVERDINAATNPVLAIAKHILFPVFETLDGFSSFESLEEAFGNGSVSAQRLKQLVIHGVIQVLTPVQVLLGGRPLAMLE